MAGETLLRDQGQWQFHSLSLFSYFPKQGTTGGLADYKATAQYLYLMKEDGVWKNEEIRGQ